MDMSREAELCRNGQQLDLPDVFLDFLKHDDRPTLILDTHTRRILFRNAAFESQISCDRHEIQSWIENVPAVAKDSASETIDLGAFVHEEWLGKSVGRSLMAIFCSRNVPEMERISEGANMAHKDNLDNTQSARTPKLRDMRMGWLEPSHDPWMSFIRQYPFGETALGSMQDWPNMLRQTVRAIMTCPEPRILYWGDDLCMVYNEAAVPVIGKKHPCLGKTLISEWGQPVHNQIVQTIEAVIKQGKAFQARNVQFILERNGFPEQTWHHFHQLPITSSEGYFLGCLCEFVENTTAYVQENRSTVMDACLKAASNATQLNQLWSGFLDAVKRDSLDIVSGLVYSVPNPEDDADPFTTAPKYILETSFGHPDAVLGAEPPSSLAKALESVSDFEQLTVLKKEDDTLPAGLAHDVPEHGTVTTVCVLLIADLYKRRLACVILGINPRRPFDDTSGAFMLSMCDLFHKSAVFIALPEQEKRNQEITSALSHKLQVALLKAEKNEETFARMARDAPIGMYMLKPDGYPTFVNDAYLELMGMTRPEYLRNADVDLAWSEAIYEEDREFAYGVWCAAVEGKKPIQAEFRVKAPTESSPGRVRWLESTSYAEHDESGNLISVRGWLVDISPRKLTERLMAEKLQDALETKRATDAFFAMLSHEIRNPLSSILQLADGILGLLAPESPSTPNMIASLIDAAQTITLCAKHQKTIIDEVLTFSKLDSNLLDLSLEKAQIPTIAQTALKMFEMELQHAKIEASMCVDRSFEDLALDYVLVDPARLLQIIINLLTNAIKFTKTSKEIRQITINIAASPTKPTEKDFGISFIAPRKEDNTKYGSSPATPMAPTKEWGGTDDVYVYISVQDTGKGLTEDETKRLFQRFAQASPKTYKTYGGSGLGLFISRGLTELQGGQIGVRSKAGVGSTFAFYIKTQRVQSPAEPSRSSSVASVEALTGVSSLPHKDGAPDVKILTKTSTSEVSSVAVSDLHILLVEDNAINQKVIGQQLRRLGVKTVHLADHGLEALKFLSTTNFARSVASKNVPLSLILLDVEMPVMDGLACVRRIRQLEATGEIIRHVPVIAITANARSEQVTVALEAGMDEVVTKPFRIPELIPRMEALVQKHLPESEEISPQPLIPSNDFW